jgi:hypothetical protein
MAKMRIFQLKMAFLSANSRFAVQDDGTYLPLHKKANNVILNNINFGTETRKVEESQIV